MTDKLFNKAELTMADIDELIAARYEENIHLDFKAAGALDKAGNKTDEISKDISAFANADGGVIIYGINEQDHVAAGKSYIDGNVYTKEWLEQVISSKIHRQIEGLTIIPIRENGNMGRSIYVVRIPRSNLTPHMAADHRFYKRQNFKNVMLEEYEVRDLMGRRASSRLVIDGHILHYVDDGNTIAYYVKIANESNVVEGTYKVNVYIKGKILDILSQMKVSWSPMEERLHQTIMSGKIKLTAVGDSPIFPGECMDLCHFQIESDDSFSEQILKESSIEAILYNQVGEQARFETSMYDALLR